MFKKILWVIAGLVLVGGLGAGGFAYAQIQAFDASMAKTYDVPLPKVTLTHDVAQLERGKHLANSLGGCNGCHGQDFASARTEDLGPLGKLRAPNITTGKNGVLSSYSDAELARLIQHGVRRNGQSVVFMPSGDFSWWPDEDVDALIAYLRSLPPVDGEAAQIDIGVLGKILDRLDKIPLDIARRIDHAKLPEAPVPSETPVYGAFVSRLCMGCHGPGLAGGAIPGAPPEIPIPLNLTPHESGLKEWRYADFEKLMRTGVRKNGNTLNPFMPLESFKNLNDMEMKALFAYLQTVKPAPFGDR